MRHTFQAEQWLPFPLPVVFAFFANPKNLPPLMPAWQQARIEELHLIAPPAPPPASPTKMGTGVGTTMVLSFRALPLLPLRMRWLALIPEFEWNDHFCDTQTAGPFHYWRHCHSVRMEVRGDIEGTVVHDHVDYELPGGRLGDLANLLGGRLQIRYIFGYRHRQTAKLLPEFARSLEAPQNGTHQ
ncbi:MAG: SRPBCC family protein [Janthinobacterium lividum]